MNSNLHFLFGAGQRAAISVLFGLLLTLAGCAHQSVEPASLGGSAAGERTGRDTAPSSALAGAAADAADDATSRALDTMSDVSPAAPSADDSAASSMAACACGKAFEQTGVATWYGNLFHGRRTASGERYNMHAFTAAHRTLPLGACVRVTALNSARSVIVRINDRGPFVRGRVIDLSYAAAQTLGVVSAGSAQVKLERVAAGRQAAAGRACPEPGA